VRIAKGDSADCANPRLTPDGEDVVFESTARRVTGFLSEDGVSTFAHTIDNVTAGINRVYRIRIRPQQVGSSAPYFNATYRSAIIQRISPRDLDLGLALPQGSN
jgi:hypothetical protein